MKSNSFNLELFRKTYNGPTVRVKLVVMEKTAPYLPTTPFTSSEQVADYFSPLEEEPREILIAMHLDNKHRALSIEEVSKGTLTTSLFEPRAILQAAILANAAAAILVHQHPAGDPKPSPEDISVTKALKQLTDLLPIRLLDHVIIGRKSYYSLADNGVI
jgi:DNA repair protein RadC